MANEMDSQVINDSGNDSENVLTYITAVSEITPEICARYIRLDAGPEDLQDLGMMLTVAKAFVRAYTGVADLDDSSDFVLCVLILVQDQWDNRTLYIDKGNLNRTVESILDLHSVNLL